jgi:hypothetical protein
VTGRRRKTGIKQQDQLSYIGREGEERGRQVDWKGQEGRKEGGKR